MLYRITALVLAIGLAAQPSGAVDREAMAAYYRCEGMAQARALSGGEAAACSVLYERAKLGFLGIGEGAFHALPSEERVEAARRAFRALRAWEAAHPEILDGLKAWRPG